MLKLLEIIFGLLISLHPSLSNVALAQDPFGFELPPDLGSMAYESSYVPEDCDSAALEKLNIEAQLDGYTLDSESLRMISATNRPDLPVSYFWYEAYGYRFQIFSKRFIVFVQKRTTDRCL